MRGYLCSGAMLIAVLVGLLAWTETVWAVDDRKLKEQEEEKAREKAALLAKQQEERVDKQMKGLAACVAAVVVVSVVFWILNATNKVKKQRALQDRQQPSLEDDPLSAQAPPPSEPTAGYW
jgi:heme exporter protein D